MNSWTPIVDAGGNPDVPGTARTVLVFLCGDRPIGADRPDGAGWGERLGWYDQDRRAWRVGGSLFEGYYVTHWTDLPGPPETARG